MRVRVQFCCSVIIRITSLDFMVEKEKTECLEEVPSSRPTFSKNGASKPDQEEGLYGR
jgi:hypothetical protein